MRRITLWLAVTSIVCAFAFAYQTTTHTLALSEGAKSGETRTPPTTTNAPTAAREGANTDHTNKPGESK